MGGAGGGVWIGCCWALGACTCCEGVCTCCEGVCTWVLVYTGGGDGAY